MTTPSENPEETPIVWPPAPTPPPPDSMPAGKVVEGTVDPNAPAKPCADGNTSDDTLT